VSTRAAIAAKGDGKPVSSCDTDSVCPCCGPKAASRVWMDEGGGTRYRRCRTCGTVFASPRGSLRERLAWLDRTFGLGDVARENEAARAPALETESAILTEHAPSGRLLDIGCDLGLLFAWFPSDRWERHGVELSPSAAEFAANRWEAKVAACSLQAAGFPSEHFDLVTMIDMLYYVEDPAGDVREAFRILRPGGILGIEVSGQAYQFTRSRGPICWLLDGVWTRLRSDSSYLWWFSPHAVFRMIEAAGLELVGCHVVGSPRSRSWLRRALARIHTALLSVAADLWPGALTWAPKYLVIARRPPS